MELGTALVLLLAVAVAGCASAGALTASTAQIPSAPATTTRTTTAEIVTSTDATAASSAADGQTGSEKTRAQLVFSTAGYSSPDGNFAMTVQTSAAVALIRVLAGSQEIRANQPDLGKQIFPDSYVLTPVQIEQLYKTDGKLNPGDVVRIEEYYATAQDPVDPGLTLVFVSGFYVPMKVGHKYILFLGSPQYAGDYQIHTSDFGKFVYSNKTTDGDPGSQLSQEEWEVGGPGCPGVPPQYFRMATQVMETYAR